MSKAFLSHSSKDKHFVKQVADNLGSALCHYDERTFEPSGESAEEILKALTNSDVFVLFFSSNSQSSEWVKQEIKYARHMFFEGKIKSVAIIPLDGTPREDLDIWLKPFVVQTLLVPRLVALRVRSLIAQHEQHTSPRFVGRDGALSDLKEKLRDQSPNKPSAILLSGVSGIGKRLLARRAFQDLYPFLPSHWVELNLSPYEGEVVLYERLLECFEPSADWAASREKIDAFLEFNAPQRAEELSRIISSIEKAKQIVTIQFSDDIINSEGNIDPWLLSAIRTAKSSYPTLVILTTRGLSPKALASLSDIPSIKLNSLEEKYAQQLISGLLDDMETGAPASIINQVVTSVGGHPGLLELSAKLIKAVGAPRFRIDLSSHDRKSALEEYVEKAIANVPLLKSEKAALLLTDELGGATREDILAGLSPLVPDIDFSEILAKLIDFGLLEDSGDDLHSAPHLRLVMRRWSKDKEIQEILVAVRINLVAILDEVQSLSGGSYLALRAPIAAAIRTNGDYNHPLVNKPLLAAQQLRVARRLYDERLLDDAAERAQRAFENRLALSDDGTIEALRILGLIGARRKRQDLKELALTELDRTPGDKPRKIAAFIRGFESRLGGDFKQAEQHLKVALDKGGAGDFHVLRELAAALLEQGRAQEAEQHARRALLIAPNNPYILDILSASLIDRLRESPSDQKLEDEIEAFLRRLTSSDEREQQTFSPRRKISFAIAKRDYALAKQLLDEEKKYAQKTWYKSLLGEYLLKTGDSRGALEQLEGLIRPQQEMEMDESVVEFGITRCTRILALADSGRSDEAVTEYDRNSRLIDQHRRKALHRDLVGEIARSTANHSEVVRKFASTPYKE